MPNLPSRRIQYRHLPMLGGMLIASVAVAQINGIRKEIVQPIPPGASTALPQGSGDWDEARARILNAADTPVILAVDEWKRLRQSDGLGFAAYSSFIMAHPGWPGEDRIRRLAETSINPRSYSPPAVVAFFQQFPPRSATAGARYALALSALGRMDEARAIARAAWRTGAMNVEDESWILQQFGSVLTPQDHVAHADAALWARNSGSAERVLTLLPESVRPVVAGRIAMQRRSIDAAALTQAASPFAQGHAGFIADRASWLRDMGNALLARTLLADREPLSVRPADPEEWYELLLTHAREAANDGQWTTAYKIASKIDDAYQPGVDVRDQSLGERDDYTSLAWLAGTTALYQLGRPRDAMAMFDRYANAARSPQTMSKGWYWAGRAAQQAGDQIEATRHMTLAANYPDQFYGQLARERLGQPVAAPARPGSAVAVTDNDRQAFEASSLVRAARALGTAGRWNDQSLFLRAIAASVATDVDRVLASELAETIRRPDLGVMVGRKARPDGSSGYSLASFPSVPVPADQQDNWTMIHAIARQESQFDKAAISHAGARGLMQLMPGTAQETAGKVGLAYMPGSLTSDTHYNIMLGSSYFRRMLNYYGGSYPLAIAAYNAGPGNVNKWLRANGDPRVPGTDVLRWIEQIPIYETRNYVQRVLENAVVYDAIRAQKAGTAMAPRALSRYLGNQGAG